MPDLAEIVEEQAWIIRTQAETIERLSTLLLQYVGQDEIDKLIEQLQGENE